MASTNLTHFLEQQGRKVVLQAYIEGMPDILCTEQPANPLAEHYCLLCAGTTLSEGVETPSVAINTLLPNGELTYIGTIKPTSFSSQNREFFEFRSLGGNGYSLKAQQTTGKVLLTVGTDTHTFDTTLTSGAWHIVGVTLGGSAGGWEARLVVVELDSDGQIVRDVTERISFAGDDIATRAAWSDSVELGLGGGTSPDGFGFVGYISHTLLFDAAMTVSDIRRVAFRTLDSSWPQWDDLVCMWRFSENAGTTVRNEASTLSSYDLAFVSTPTWTDDRAFPVTYRELMDIPTAQSQEIEPRAARASISGFSFKVLDTAGWLTSWLAAVSQKVRDRSCYVFLGFSGLPAADYSRILAGAIESVSPLLGRGYEIRAGDAKRFLRSSFLLGETTLAASLTDSATSMTVATLYGFMATTTAAQNAGNNPTGYVRIDDEVIKYTGASVGASQQFTGLTRAALGTTAAAHSDGAKVQEVLYVGNAHPSVWYYRMLCSDDNNDFRGSLGALDEWVRFAADNDLDSTLGRGAGLSKYDFNLSGMNTIFSTYHDTAGGTYKGSLFVDRSIEDIKRWLEEQVLKPLRAFFYVESGGKLALGIWDDRAAGGSPTILDQDALVRPQVTIGSRALVNNIESRYEREIVDGSFARIQLDEDLDSQRDYGRAEPIRVDSSWIRDDDFGGTTFTPSTITDDLATALFERFNSPIYWIEAAVSLQYWETELDEIVQVQHEELPDLVTGLRGLSGADFQVVGRRLDLRRGVVVLKLLRMP